jgi:preprotein translocase subunit SecG
MGTLLISFLTLVLILISAFIVLLVLMQRTSQSGGMGAALGGGATESAFGADTNNVLTKATIYSIIAFFVVSLGLFLFYQSKAAERSLTLSPEELISAPEPESSVLNSTAEPPLSVENISEPAVKTVEKGLNEAESNFKAVSEAAPESEAVPKPETAPEK